MAPSQMIDEEDAGSVSTFAQNYQDCLKEREIQVNS
jgi:hypothetical protein